MQTIDPKTYPKNKEWSEKISTTPSVPGGKSCLLENLRRMLEAVGRGDPLDGVPDLADSGSGCPLGELCVRQLSPLRLAERTAEGWAVTEEAQRWLTSGDDLYLAAYFAANVRFFAEILYYLDSPKTSSQLFKIATDRYDMPWKTISTLNNRLIWLRQFGLVEFWEFSLLYSLTERGKQFLEHVSVVLPEELGAEDATAGETSAEVPEPFVLFSGETAVRKAGLGYLPGKMSEICGVLSAWLGQIAADGSFDAIDRFAKERYSIKPSSARSALSTLAALGLIVRTSNTAHSLTDLGSLWLEEGSALFLLPLFQRGYLFVYELLAELDGKALDARELAAKAQLSYGFAKEDVFEVNARLALLKEAGVIMNVSAERYTATHRGKLFLERYAKGIEEQSPAAPAAEQDDLLFELRQAAKDSVHPKRLEKAVCDLFAEMGFEATWLGGSGNPDVVLKTTGLPVRPYVVTVDAKATMSGAVNDGLVDFDTLEEHRSKFGSDYVAVVGRDFNDRLIRRAEEHGVVLFDLDAMERLFSLHRRAPLGLAAYREVFCRAGRADLSALEEGTRRAEFLRRVLLAILQRLIEERDDPITKGELSVRNLYIALRTSAELKEKLTIEDIETALEFLSSPMVGCVARGKEGFSAVASVGDFARLMSFYGRSEG